MPRAERLYGALELSALARGLAHVGAERNAASLGAAAVQTRYLRQLYGDREGLRIDQLLQASGGESGE